MKLKKIKSLKYRILINISILLLLALFISTAVAYGYFIDTTKQETIKEYQRRNVQLASQMDLMAEDIISFSKNIAVDDVIQKNIQQKDFENYFLRIKNQTVVNDKLKFYNSLRQYIATTTIFSVNDLKYNSRSFFDDKYFISKQADKVYRDYAMGEDNEQLVFSGPYKAIEVEIKGDLIAYKMAIKNIKRPTQTIGILIVEVHKSYFEKVLADNKEGYEELEWMNGQGKMLYQKNKSNEAMLSYGDFKGENNTLIKKTKQGYIIGERLPHSKWVLGGFISNHKISEKTMFSAYFFILFFIISLILIVAMMNSVLSNMIRPITELTQTMEIVGNESMDVKVYIDSGDEIEKLYKGFNHMLKNIKHYMQEQLDHEKQIKEMEFDIMLAQINPHYLYNVLNTVVYKATADNNTEIVSIVNSLIKIMQESLKVGEKSIYTTVEKEIDIIESYLKIQEYRYPEVFRMHYNMDTELMQCQIPKTIIQPIIENAIFHGISQKGEKGNIYLDIYKEQDNLVIKVKDDGIGMDKEMIDKFMTGEAIILNKEDRKHIGIANIRDRINYLYPDKGSINVESRVNQYTIFTIILPLKHNNI